MLMLDLLAMMTVEPMLHCMADSSVEDNDGGSMVLFRCDAWTDEMSLAYETWLQTSLSSRQELVPLIDTERNVSWLVGKPSG